MNTVIAPSSTRCLGPLPATDQERRPARDEHQLWREFEAEAEAAARGRERRVAISQAAALRRCYVPNMVLVAEPKDASPFAQAVADLWNRVHSLDVHFSGIKGAVLIDRKPVGVKPAPAGPIALCWVEERKGRAAARIVRVATRDFARLIGSIELREVLLAEPDMPADAYAAMKAAGFSREVSDRQVTGHWFERGERIPDARPTYFPTIAVLPQLGRTLTSAPCLFLIAVDWIWYPLSEVAIHTYSHASDLSSGRRGVFVPSDAEWPTVYGARWGGLLDPEELAASYGPDAAKRARANTPLALIVLTAP